MKFSVFFLLLSVSLISCDSRRSLPLFATIGETGKPVEQRLFPDESGQYLLKEPVMVLQKNRAFYLRYRGGGSGSTLRVLGTEHREIAAKALPPSAEATVYLPLERGRVVQGFQVDPLPVLPAAQASGMEAAAHTEILEAGIGRAVEGFKQSGRRLTVGTMVQRLNRDGPGLELAVTGPESWQIAIVLESRAPFSFGDFRLREASAEGRLLVDGGRPEEDPPGGQALRRSSLLIRLSSGDDSVSFKNSALSGRRLIHIYPGLVPFTPEIIRVEPEAGGALWLESLEITGLPPSAAVEHPHPLPADPGTVLAYDPNAWRRREYELFSWSRFPEILIMDTASYALQSLFFKRLAFFVEKRGYRGRLVSNEEFAGLHGFNAHDYRAEDLARFFQTAREQRFTLNPEEETLKQILLANRIIRDEGEYMPGNGGILSISRGSYPILRRQLLIHECAHGLFFSLPEFRRASFDAWERLSGPEQDFWKLFFRWVGYDTEDSFLTVNEYQAYLFQQPRSGVHYYFATLTASRLVSSYPGQADWVRELVRTDPDRFTRAFDQLEVSLVRIAGVEGGRVIELELLEKK